MLMIDRLRTGRCQRCAGTDDDDARLVVDVYTPGGETETLCRRHLHEVIDEKCQPAKETEPCWR